MSSSKPDGGAAFARMQIVAAEYLRPGTALMVPARRPFETDAELAKRSVLVTNLTARQSS